MTDDWRCKFCGTGLRVYVFGPVWVCSTAYLAALGHCPEGNK